MSKADFVSKELTDLLKAVDEQIGYAEYVKERDREFVNIVSKSGNLMSSVNVTLDSKMAIARDVMKSMDY